MIRASVESNYLGLLVSLLDLLDSLIPFFSKLPFDYSIETVTFLSPSLRLGGTLKLLEAN